MRVLLAIAAGLALAGAALAEPVDWNAVNEHGVIRVVTSDEDGDVRETKAWIGVWNGTGWVRTNDSRWFKNIQRDPKITLRAGDAEYPMLAEKVDDPELRKQVDAVFNEKYRMARVMGWFGADGGDNLLKLVPVQGGD